MKEIIVFYQENKEWLDKLIYLLVSVVVTVLVCVIKKKPVKVVNGIMDYIYDLAPSAIRLAESSEYKGQEKLDFCTGIILNALRVRFGLSEKELYTTVGLIHHVVEDILSTPQKKEAK